MPRRESNPLVDVIGLLLIVFGVLCFAATISYNWLDVGYLANPPNDPAQNMLGRFGAYLGYSTFQLYGVGGFLLPLVLFGSAALVLTRAVGRFGIRLAMLWVAFTSVVLLLQMGDHRFGSLLERFNMQDSGGLLGHLITSRALLPAVGKGMTILLLVSLWFGAIVLLFNVALKDLCIDAYHLGAGGARRAGEATSRAAGSLRAAVPAGGMSDEERGKGLMVFPDELLSEVEAEDEDDEFEFEELAPKKKSKPKKPPRKEKPRKEKPLKKLKPAVGLAVQTAPPPLEEDEVLPWEKGLPDEEPLAPAVSRATPKAQSAAQAKKAAKTKKAQQEEMFAPEDTASTNDEPYELPPLGLLDPLPQRKRGENRKDIEARGDKLIDTLKDFKVEAELTNAVIGPVVTTYELLPAPGVRVEKIASLAPNISLSLKAESIRVQAPIPGKGVVGIEIPNSKPSIVYSRELMEVKSWGSKKRALPLIIGKDAAGRNIIADLAEMPHLLIAGVDVANAGGAPLAAGGSEDRRVHRVQRLAALGGSGDHRRRQGEHGAEVGHFRNGKTLQAVRQGRRSQHQVVQQPHRRHPARLVRSRRRGTKGKPDPGHAAVHRDRDRRAGRPDDGGPVRHRERHRPPSKPTSRPASVSKWRRKSTAAPFSTPTAPTSCSARATCCSCPPEPAVWCALKVR